MFNEDIAREIAVSKLEREKMSKKESVSLVAAVWYIIQKNEINVGLVCVMKQELLAIRTRTEQSSCVVTVAVRSIKRIQRFVDLGPILKQNLESFKSCLNLNSMLVISTSLKSSTSK